MKKIIHFVAATVATLCVFIFFTSTVIVEIFGSNQAVAHVKELIVFPGLFVLVPAIAITGITGFALGKERKGALVQRKMAKMPVIGLNGVLVLVPSAIYLHMLASSGEFGVVFNIVQGIELTAGVVNLCLMAINMKDGLKLSRQSCPNMGLGRRT